MRTFFATILIALLLGVGIVAMIETDPGYVLVSYGEYTLETSLWVGLLMLMLLALVVFLLLRLVYRLIGGQRSLANWFGSRKAAKAVRQSTSGLINFTEGNWVRARRELLLGAQQNDTPLLNYLLAARSSDKLREPEQVQEYLRAAGEAESGAAIAIELTAAELKLQAGEYAQAVAALPEARLHVGKHPQVLTLLRQAYEGLNDWGQLYALLPDIRKYQKLSDKEYAQLEREVSSQFMAQSAEDTAAVEKLPVLWQKMPGHLKQDPGMLNAYVGHLLAAGADDAAEKTILRALKSQWDAGLVRQFGLLSSGGVPRKLAQAERWLATHTEDAQLLLCLGRLSARDKLWGKARDYYESSYRLEHSVEVCAELGRLLTALGEPKVAAAYFREGLMMTAAGLPELPMPDKTATPGQLMARS